MKRLVSILVAGMSLVCFFASPSNGATMLGPVPYPQAFVITAPVPKGDDPMDKVDSGLRLLYRLYAPSSSAGRTASSIASKRQSVAKMFGVSATETDPIVSLIVRVGSSDVAQEIQARRAQVLSTEGDLLRVTTRLLNLPVLAALPGVKEIAGIRSVRTPTPPTRDTRKSSAPLPKGALPPAPEAFDHHGLTGKGVIFCDIDSGIDWRHPDFIKADGTSRILYLYDMTDNSFTESHGAIGTAPPLKTDKAPIGTLYTQAQLNGQLRGTAVVHSSDTVGHGTACAGTAAGNGRAGIALHNPVSTGVAPEADLIIVKMDNGSKDYVDAAEWVFNVAANLHKPCVINMSFGSQLSRHNGKELDERYLSAMVGAGKPGRVLCVAAGNDGDKNIHGVSRFGPRVPNQVDVNGTEVEADNFEDRCPVLVLLPHGDDWALSVIGSGFPGTDGHGHMLELVIDGVTKKRGIVVVPSGSEAGKPTSPLTIAPALRANLQAELADAEPNYTQYGDYVLLNLPPGRHIIRAFGAGPSVTSGAAHVYALGGSVISHGALETGDVSSPGNADNAITVGAYVARSTWTNCAGQPVSKNVKLGDIATFSSVGYRLDGQIKPDIVAPGEQMISPAVKGSEMALDHPELFLTCDGRYLAWQGTSAASPFTAGTIALMLQKNPTLDSEQIRSILIKTAEVHHDALSGALPNPRYGNGRLDPEAAIVQTPAPPDTPSPPVPVAPAPK